MVKYVFSHSALLQAGSSNRGKNNFAAVSLFEFWVLSHKTQTIGKSLKRRID
jgi:hypothetical protein